MIGEGLKQYFRGVVPIGRTAVSKTDGWGFESLHPCQFSASLFSYITHEFKITFVVALMVLTILAQNLGALTVPNTCSEAQTPEWNVRTGFQLALILLVFSTLILISYKRIANIKRNNLKTNKQSNVTNDSFLSTPEKVSIPTRPPEKVL